MKISSLLFFLYIIVGCSNIENKTSNPNIILINFDDMGYGDTEPYGMTGIRTPNINKLSQEGMRFTNFMAGSAVCSASRASLLTGCYSCRVGINGALLPSSKIALNPEEETIASVLKGIGYTTAMLGKWHLGNEAPYFPLSYGFDSFYGIPYSNDIWPVDYDGKPITDPSNKKGNWPPLKLIEGNEPVDTIADLNDQAKLTTIFTERALEIINTNAGKENPFFLYLAHPMPHVPIAVSDLHKGSSELGLFGDVITELDWSVGEIEKALKANGIDDNTIVIMTSDNGPWKNFGNHAGSTGGFREGKNTTFDGGNRVPCIIKWPGKIEGGTVNSQLVSNIDILPTLCDITGAQLPEKKIDGINFLPLLLDKQEQGKREEFYYYWGFGMANLEAVRYKNWKLVLPHNGLSYYEKPQGKDGYPGEYGMVSFPMALYNTAQDPSEDYDLQDQYPEMVKKLLEIADEARLDLGDALTKQKGENVREAAFIDK